MRHVRLFLVLLLVPVILMASVSACGTTETPMESEAPEEMAAPEEVEAPEEEEVQEEAEAPVEEMAVEPSYELAAAEVPQICLDDPDMESCAVIAAGDPIKIGYAGPMTGDYSAFGIDISQAGSLAVEKFGKIGDFMVELDIQDTQGSGEGGATVANYFVSDPTYVAIAGHTFSGSTAAAIPIYNEARLPMLSPSATRADLTEGDQDVFNRIAFTDDVQGTNVADYLYDTLEVRKIAIMHDGDAYGQGLAEKVREVFTEKGGEVVAFEPITPSEPDYTGPLSAIAALSPEALFYGGYDAEAAVLKKQMGVAGLDEVVFFSDDGAYGVNFLDIAGDSAEGTYATSAVPPASPENDAFEASYLDATGQEAGSLSTFTWHGYDVVSALISAIAETAVLGEDGNLYIPREELVLAVRNLSGFAGLTGEISCDASGECNTAGPTFFVVEGGEWIEAQ